MSEPPRRRGRADGRGRGERGGRRWGARRERGREQPQTRHRWGSRERGPRGPLSRWTGGSRGQSTTLEYTLALAVAALAVTGLFAAAGDFVTGQREQVIRTELGVISQQLASDVVAADRLVRAGESTGELRINASTPPTVSGTGYTVTVVDVGSSAHELRLSTSQPDVTVTARVETETDVATGAVDGGSLVIVYDPGGPALEVRS